MRKTNRIGSRVWYGRVTVLAGEFAECLLPADRGLACRDRGRS